MEALVAIELANLCKCERRPPETCSRGSSRRKQQSQEEGVDAVADQLPHRCVEQP